ncbi:MAG: GGDEF domain-containing protein [Acidimicrobiia bacterium]
MASDARETAGTTICLIVRYVRHHAGDDGVTRLLEVAGETRSLEQLEDEHRWSTYEQKIALFDAACFVLDDNDAVLRIGATALDHQVGAGIRILLRTLGSPRTVLANVAKACPKFSTVASMSVEELGREHATVTYRLHDGYRPHRGDCQLNIALMGTIGLIFGIPPLEVVHPDCQVEGAPECRYVVTWTKPRRFRGRRTLVRALEDETNALHAQIALLQSTTEDLVSSDDVDTVLARIVSRAGTAVSAPAHLLALYDHELLGAAVYADGIAPDAIDAVATEVLQAPLGSHDHQIVIEVASSRRIYGRLAAYSDGHTFFAHEERLLAAYARSAAAALDAATALESARRRGAATGALLGLARSLAEPANPQRIARLVASAMPEILGVDAAAVLLWDQGTQTLRMAGRSGWSREVADLVEGFEIRDQDSDGVRQLRETAEPIVLRLDSPERGPVATRLAVLGVPALAIAPIHVHRGEFFGAAIAPVAAAHERRLDDITERLAAIADQAATAIQNATLIEEIRHQAVHDTLTGLANRALADEELDKAIAHAARRRASLSLLFIDLDDFKAVNDRFGHGAGDHVLRTVALRLEDAGRRGDSIARRGGDEFTMMLPDAEPSDAEVIAARLATVISRPIAIGDELVQVHASIGIACYPQDGTDVEALVRGADRAMYRTKELERVLCTVAPRDLGPATTPRREAAG